MEMTRSPAITKSGNYKITSYDLNNRYEPEKTILGRSSIPRKSSRPYISTGRVKQYYVKRFQIETTTNDKEFGFISEGIGSRLEYVTTSDTAEVEVELVKGKGKDKETEVVNLEDIIDVKGWKALGNRLSQHKVVKVKPVEDPEDSGLEEGDDENELVESPSPKGKTTGSKDAESSKKTPKRIGEEASQPSLFGETKGRKAPKQPKKPPLVPKKQAVAQASPLRGKGKRK